MKDSSRLQQQEALGILGVNLLFSSFYLHESESQFISSLVENLGIQRVEIDIIRFYSPDLTHLNEVRLNFELLHKGSSQGVLFNPDGLITQASEVFYDTPLLVQRGIFRPITNVNVNIIQKGFEQFLKDDPQTQKSPQVLMAIHIDIKESESENKSENKGGGTQNHNVEDYLRRVEIINSLGYHALVSHLKMFYELKQYLRQATQNHISMVIGASHLETLMDPSYYHDLSGGLLMAFGNFFDDRTKVYVFPYKSQEQCITAQTFKPQKEVLFLYKYLTENDMLKDISDCKETNISLHSQKVRQMLIENDTTWETLVPSNAVQLIKKHQLFGYKQL